MLATCLLRSRDFLRLFLVKRIPSQSILCTAALVVVGLAGAAPSQTAPPNQESKPKLAEEAFKNIQVLKGVPADQLIPAMQFISASLGVQCEFCHVDGKFDQDDKKPKEAARKMMRMMFATNQDSFEGRREVTCNSCHRGSPRPIAIPEIGENDAKSGPRGEAELTEPNPATLPPAVQLLDKYVKALGGAAAVEKITSRVETGTADFGGFQSPIAIYQKGGKRASIMQMAGQQSITAYDGTSGWMGSPGRPLREMHGGDLEASKMDADLQFPLHIQQMFSELKPTRPETIGDTETYQLIGAREGQPPVRFYFDQRSGLLVRLVRYVDSPLGLNPTQIDYADYRVVDGVKIPFRWTIARPGNQFTIQVEEAKQNVPVSDVYFARPPAPAAEEIPPPR
jgi:photosynthetic reaction center cytochrome c subunit